MNGTKRKKYTIQVRKYLAGQTPHGSSSIGAITGNYGKFEMVATVTRTIRAEQIGNFSPIFCTYKGKRTLVNSEAGDLSDPFRRTENYVKTFFIVIS